MKFFLEKHGIPTAPFRVFEDAGKAINYVKNMKRPFVVKTDGLAAGKGAIVNHSVEETLDAVDRIMARKDFGKSGEKVVIEEILEGEEVSVFIVTDGNDLSGLPRPGQAKGLLTATSANTGGMGSYAPAVRIDESLKSEIIKKIVRPTIEGMKSEGSPYSGVLYLGHDNFSGPAVIEYNVRFGDPEAEAILPLLKTNFLEIIESVINGRLGSLVIGASDGYCTGVVLASGGYPGSYKRALK